jgi:hypothetical protein
MRKQSGATRARHGKIDIACSQPVKARNSRLPQQLPLRAKLQDSRLSQLSRQNSEILKGASFK